MSFDRLNSLATPALKTSKSKKTSAMASSAVDSDDEESLNVSSKGSSVSVSDDEDATDSEEEVMKTRADLLKDESVINVDRTVETLSKLATRTMHLLRQNHFLMYRMYARGKENAKLAQDLCQKLVRWIVVDNIETKRV